MGNSPHEALIGHSYVRRDTAHDGGQSEGDDAMPRYIIERTFPDGLQFPTGGEGRKVAAQVADTNAGEGVTWVHSYVSDDDRTTFCVYDAPSPEAIRTVAERNRLPVDRITEVRVLDPYLYGE
jgi:hypothetical protein